MNRADVLAEGVLSTKMLLSRYLVGFDHLIPPDVPWDNMRYAADTLRAACYAAGTGL